MENMINKLAASFNATTGIDFKELKSEANLAYCEALISFKEDKGAKLSTWVYICVKKQPRQLLCKGAETRQGIQY